MSYIHKHLLRVTRLCAVLVCTYSTGLRDGMWLTDSGSMMDTNEYRESGLADKRLSKIDPSACVPNK